MHVLLPIDGSENASKTIEWAARTFDKATQYHLLTVIKIIPDTFVVEYDILDASNLLKREAAKLQSFGCNVAETDYAFGDPADEICRFAEEIKADQVVMGSHGRGGFGRLLMGSVSTAVLEHCNVPVIIYREKAEKPEPHVIPSNTVL